MVHGPLAAVRGTYRRHTSPKMSCPIKAKLTSMTESTSVAAGPPAALPAALTRLSWIVVFVKAGLASAPLSIALAPPLGETGGMKGIAASEDVAGADASADLRLLGLALGDRKF